MKKRATKKKSTCNGGEECERLGYCIIAHARYKAEEAERERAYRMREEFIGHVIPLIVPKDPINHLGEYSNKHLQVALDAYHQQDYETAILHSKAVMQANDKCALAYLCIAVSEYYMSNYEEASYYADRCATCYQYKVNVLESFSLHCVNLHREKTTAIQILAHTPVKEKPVQLDLFAVKAHEKTKPQMVLVEAIAV